MSYRVAMARHSSVADGAFDRVARCVGATVAGYRGVRWLGGDAGLGADGPDGGAPRGGGVAPVADHPTGGVQDAQAMQHGGRGAQL